MRMREMFTLSAEQVRLDQHTIFLIKTKNGDKRQIPISSVLHPLLKARLTGLTDGEKLFPWWKGSASDLSPCTNRLSHLFGARFEKAGSPDLRFHDLRHEATARIYERTSMSDLEIASITGHKDLRMLKRYANLRASVLVKKMW